MAVLSWDMPGIAIPLIESLGRGVVAGLGTGRTVDDGLATAVFRAGCFFAAGAFLRLEAPDEALPLATGFAGMGRDMPGIFGMPR